MTVLVYCKDCKSHNSWVREPAKDRVGADTGKVLWEAYICKVCGQRTIRPVGGVK